MQQRDQRFVPCKRVHCGLRNALGLGWPRIRRKEGYPWPAPAKNLSWAQSPTRQSVSKLNSQTRSSSALSFTHHHNSDFSSNPLWFEVSPSNCKQIQLYGMFPNFVMSYFNTFSTPTTPTSVILARARLWTFARFKNPGRKFPYLPAIGNLCTPPPPTTFSFQDPFKSGFESSCHYGYTHHPQSLRFSTVNQWADAVLQLQFQNPTSCKSHQWLFVRCLWPESLPFSGINKAFILPLSSPSPLACPSSISCLKRFWGRLTTLALFALLQLQLDL